MHQTPFEVRTVHSHGVQRKDLLVNAWYDPIVLLIQEETQFHHYQHLSCIVVQVKDWVNPSEADGHRMYPEGMLDPNWWWC